MNRQLVALALVMITTPLMAQWLSLPTPGIPRTADGAPDMTAPVPRGADGHPDLTGLWLPQRAGGSVFDPANVQPWARELMVQHKNGYFQDDPRFRCLPSGPGHLALGGPTAGFRRIVQNPDIIAILHADMSFRQVFMDGRELESDPLPTWMGYSVGHWDGDTLVIESNGYNDKTWVARGVSHTNQLRMTERYTRTSLGHIQIEVTYEDPGAFENTINAVVDMGLAADEQMLETVCNEAYSGDRSDWTSEVEEVDTTEVEVDPAILERYVGSYYGTYLTSNITMRVTLEDGQLYLQKGNGGMSRLIPKSDTAFVIGGFGYTFSLDDEGVPTTISEVHVSGAWPFHRVD